MDRKVTVGGLECRDRLEALQRIFEHELLHLAEFLGWGRSNCRAGNFHALSRRIFAHEGVFHDLVTPREEAGVAYGIVAGDLVSFEHEGMRHVGRVNRITRRATVLVEDPGGRPYSDGKHYLTFYVPLPMLRKLSGRIAADDAMERQGTIKDLADGLSIASSAVINGSRFVRDGCPRGHRDPRGNTHGRVGCASPMI